MLLPADRPYPKDIKHLTSLRFFAAFAIVLLHFALVWPFDLGMFSGIPVKAYMAVDFFFILSGFIMTHVYMGEVREGTFSAKTFYLKRFARIYPLHLFTLLLAVAIGVFFKTTGLSDFLKATDFPEDFTFQSFVTNILLIHAWGFEDRLSFNKPSWSVSDEWFAYLLFPVLAGILLRFKVRLALFLSFILFIVMWFASAKFLPRPITEITFDFGFLRIFPEFTAGMALYLFGQKYRLKNCSRTLLLICAALILLLLHFQVADIFVVPLFAGLILIAAEQARQKLDWGLSGKNLVYLGEISYSIYMVHFLIFYLLFFGTPLLLGSDIYNSIFFYLWMGGYGLVILVSMLSYHLIELPARRWICRVFLPLKTEKTEKTETT